MVFEVPVGGQQEGQGEHKNLTRLLTPLGSADLFSCYGVLGIFCIVCNLLINNCRAENSNALENIAGGRTIHSG